MKPQPAMNANMKHAATIFSIRLACSSSGGEVGRSPPDCSPPDPPSSGVLATGVLSAGCFVTDLARFTVFCYGGRPEQARRWRGSADDPAPRPPTLRALGLFPVAHDQYYSIPARLEERYGRE